MTSATLQIRRATPDDAPAFARVMGEPEVFANLLGMPYPDAESWRRRLAEPVAPGQVGIRWVGVRDGEVVATCGLASVGATPRQRHVATLGLAVARAAQGRGVGSTMLAALIDYAEQWAQVLRLELVVAADNAPAIALYGKFGFEVEGCRRGDLFRAGRYVDSLAMARLHRDLSVR